MPLVFGFPAARSSLRLFVLLGLTLFAGAAAAAAPTRFTVAVTGQGPDVLLIPGLSCPASVWDATVARLQTTRRVHVLQVAGFAGAPAAGNAQGPVVGPLVEEIAAYLTEQKLERPAIIGHSLGGFAAVALAARHPAMVGRVMAVDASPFFPLVMNPAATVETARPGADAVRTQVASLPQAAFAGMQALTLQRMIKDDALRASLAALAGKSDVKVVAQALHDLLTTDLRPELAAIQAPLTVLYAFDPAMAPSVAAADRLFETSFANAPAANLLRIDDSLHFIMLDQPEKFAAAVDAFLK